MTEVAGDVVTTEQIERLARRYYWAADHCVGKDVLEAACGTGQGVAHLGAAARSILAGDYSATLLDAAQKHYGDRFNFLRFDAQTMPFAAASFDIVILFEALYYLPDLDRFFSECQRVLRPNGALLISTANKDLFDFNASPYSYRYLGVTELASELAERGFEVECFGDTPITGVSARQRYLRPLKAFAARLGLVPKSMHMKKLLKRAVFGGLVPMPAEIGPGTTSHLSPTRLDIQSQDHVHKVILCAAKLAG